MSRLFVAIDLPEEHKKKLDRIQFGVPGARWLKEDQIHLTLCFIGEVPAHKRLDIEETLANINAPAFSLELKGIGHFPPRGEPRVLWLGVDNNDSLHHLQKKIETALTRLGIEFERRKFTPHVSLARLKESPIDKVGLYIQENALFRCEPFLVDAFHLYSSTLNPNGARYTQEASFELEPNLI